MIKHKVSFSQSLLLGQQALERGDFPCAISVLQYGASLNPLHADCALLLGKAALLGGEGALAKQSLTKAIALGHTESEVFLYLGMAYVGNGQPSLALNAFREGLDAQNRTPALTRQLHYQIARIYYDWNEGEKSLFELNAALAADGESRELTADILTLQAQIYGRQNSTENLEAVLRRLLALTPADGLTARALADVLMKKGCSEDALAVLHEAQVQIHAPEEKALLFFSIAAIYLERFEQADKDSAAWQQAAADARQALQNALEENSALSPAARVQCWMSLAELSARQSHFSDVEESLTHALQDAKVSTDVSLKEWVQLYHCEFLTGQKQYETALSIARSLCGATVNAYRFYGLYAAASLLHLLHQEVESQSAYQLAIATYRTFPNDPDARIFLSQALQDTGPCRGSKSL